MTLAETGFLNVPADRRYQLLVAFKAKWHITYCKKLSKLRRYGRAWFQEPHHDNSGFGSSSYWPANVASTIAWMIIRGFSYLAFIETPPFF